MPLISVPELTRFAEDVLMGAGVPADKAEVTAACLIASNLRGVDSHGMQLLPFYVDQLLAGEMDPRTDGRVISEAGSCLLFDGQNGIGQWMADICCRHAVRIAREQGMAMVVARESNHFGAAAWWAQKMRAASQIGIVLCNASPIVPPWQGKEGRVGTNPICVALPGPWLLDMATTTVAAGKVFKAFLNGQPEIPAGWAFNSEGVPTTDTQEAYKGMLMPLGGYKGQRAGHDGGDPVRRAGRRRHVHRGGRHPLPRQDGTGEPDVPGDRHRALHAGGGVHGRGSKNWSA